MLGDWQVFILSCNVRIGLISAESKEGSKRSRIVVKGSFCRMEWICGGRMSRLPFDGYVFVIMGPSGRRLIGCVLLSFGRR